MLVLTQIWSCRPVTITSLPRDKAPLVTHYHQWQMMGRSVHDTCTQNAYEKSEQSSEILCYKWWRCGISPQTFLKTAIKTGIISTVCSTWHQRTFILIVKRCRGAQTVYIAVFVSSLTLWPPVPSIFVFLHFLLAHYISAFKPVKVKNVTLTSKIWNLLSPILLNLNNFHSLEVVDRVSETQLQVSENSNWIIWRLKG